MTPYVLHVLQSVQDVSQSLREFGVAVTMLLIMTLAFFGALWYGAKYFLPAILQGYEKQIEQLRLDHKEDRDRDNALVALQRAEFLTALANSQQSFKDSLDRVERHCNQQVQQVQQQHEQVCKRLDALIAEVERLVETKQ